MRAGALAVLTAAVAAAAGCGGGSSSNGEASKAPAQVLRDAVQAARSASAVHVSGKISEKGTPLGVDLHVERDRGKGSISENGLRFDLIRIGGTAYVRGSDAFYRQVAGAAAAQLLHGKWLKAPASKGDFAQLAALTDTKRFFGQLTGGHGKLRNEGEKTYEGRKVVAIRDTTQGGTLYVAATGKPYPVAIVGSGSSSGTLAFSDWNDEVPITAPEKAIELAQLGG